MKYCIDECFNFYWEIWKAMYHWKPNLSIFFTAKHNLSTNDVIVKYMIYHVKIWMLNLMAET